jgi:cell division protein FtsB
MVKLLEILSAQKRLWQQRQEIDQLRQELAKLRAQNDSMRDGMRRCVTCDYRIDFKLRQDGAQGARQAPATTQTDHEH